MKTRGEADELITTINVAPLVDIGLVLLIIVMVAMTYVAAQALPMELPSEGTSPEAAERLQVEVGADGSITVDGHASSFGELAERARRFARATREPHAVVAADPEASHGAFVRAVDVLRTAGVRRYTVAVPAAIE
jgi:biopolymer transport protein ExbD